MAPDKSAVVSVGSEGGIFIWEYAQPAVEPEGGAGAGDFHQQLQHLAVEQH